MVIRYCKFDTFTPAAERGLPVTRVISRMTLQKILATAVGDDIILNGSNVVDFEDDGKKVKSALLSNFLCSHDSLVDYMLEVHHCFLFYVSNLGYCYSGGWTAL